MGKIFKHRLVGAWKLLAGQGFVISKTPPSYPFVLHIGDKIEALQKEQKR